MRSDERTQPKMLLRINISWTTARLRVQEPGNMMSASMMRAALLAGVAMAACVPAALQAADAGKEGDEIVVTGSKPVTVASGGTKTDTPILETPQSISVVDASEIADLGLQNLNQALRFVSGVTPETRGASAEVYDQFKLRGFDAPIYLDGLKLFNSATGYAVPQIDVSRLDRVEIIKGPASALYGQSGPGGLVVEQSKLPLDRDFYGSVSGTYGNYDLYRADADVGGRFSSTALWRLYGSANGSDDQQTYGRRERQTVSGAVTLGAGTPTSFTVLGAYSHDPRNGNYGVFPAVGTLIDNPAGKISTHFYGGEPGDFFKREQAGLTYIFQHDFGGGWKFRSLGRYQYVSSHLGIVYTGGYPVDAFDAVPSPAPTLFSRYSYSTREKLNAWTYDNQLTGAIDTGPLHHSLIFGTDRQVAHSYERFTFGGGTPIDVFNPVYGTMPTPSDPDHVIGYDGVTPATPGVLTARQRQQGVYGQDQISAGGFRLTLSGRYDWARVAGSGLVNKNEKFTYRVGGLYLFDFGLAPYVSYSTSFEQQSQALADGSLPKPSLGKQFEAGLKYKVPGTEILITGAWFDIKQTNVAVPDALFSYTQAGKVRARGIELEAAAPLPYDFNAKLSFSRQHQKVLEDANPINVGHGLPTVGRGGVSAYIEWAPKSGPASGFVVGGDVRYVDRTYAATYLDGVYRNTPSYTVFDALLRYDLGKISPRLENVRLGVNATNLFDKRYLTSCFTNYGWCWYGNRRAIQGTVGVSW